MSLPLSRAFIVGSNRRTSAAAVSTLSAGWRFHRHLFCRLLLKLNEMITQFIEESKESKIDHSDEDPVNYWILDLEKPLGCSEAIECNLCPNRYDHFLRNTCGACGVLPSNEALIRNRVSFEVRRFRIKPSTLDQFAFK